jgi:hypothetical protein
VARTGAVGATNISPGQFEQIGRSLAHVIFINEGEEVVLGQAWLAARGTLVTCGHVVDQFVTDPGALSVKFLASGNQYAVRKIKLHPGFARQPDRLVKFDVATLSVTLAQPEVSVPPLSFAYECAFRKDQMLVAIRFPVHLGALTDSPEPIVQGGKLLGHLHKQDQFHWLHDLGLAPGDSGTALFDGNRVVAIHCGDTATLPGLNLPTTAIRLALWVDALRDLGLPESAAPMYRSRNRPLVLAVLAFMPSLLTGFLVTMLVLFTLTGKGWTIEQPTVMPIDVRFNEPVLGYKANERVTIELVPRNDCHLYLFDDDGQNHVYCVYPPPGFAPLVKALQKRSISQFGNTFLTAGVSKEKLHLVALISNDPIVKESDWQKVNPAGSPLTINAEALKARIADFERLEPENVLHIELDAPRAL